MGGAPWTGITAGGEPVTLTPACALRLRAAAALVPPARPDSSPPLPSPLFSAPNLPLSLLFLFYVQYSIYFTAPQGGLRWRHRQ
jgi:hypothetical protein